MHFQMCTQHLCMLIVDISRNTRFHAEYEKSFGKCLVGLTVKPHIMETGIVVSNVSQESALDAGVILAELHQTEKIETVVVTGDFIELGSSYDTGEQTAASAGNDNTKVFEVINVQPDSGEAAESGMEVCEKYKCSQFMTVTKPVNLIFYTAFL